MFSKLNFKAAAPYIFAVILFVALSYAFMPQVIVGKVIMQEDVSAWRGMAQEVSTWNKEHPKEPALWTNSMFSGMPSVLINGNTKGNLLEPLNNILMQGQKPSMVPAAILVVSMLGAFLLLLTLGTGPWIAMVGAIALSFCAYNFQIIQVGHINKMIAMAYMPWVLASLIYAYRKNSLFGSIFFGISMFLEIRANHVQITYYLAFIVLAVFIALLCEAIKQKQLPKFIKTSCLVLVMGLVGIATNTNSLLPLYEYSKYSTRGGSELASANSTESKGGLDIDYATSWSYGKMETFNLLIPNLYGGSSVGALSAKSNVANVLERSGYDSSSFIKAMPTYWGPQPFTAGPMYMGAVLIFLFVLGLFLIKSPMKWAMAIVSLVAVFLAWGSHFMIFTKLFFNIVPMYNKFRTVSMILVILQITMPMIGFVAFSRLINGEYDRNTSKRAILWSLCITGGVCLLFWLIPSLAGNFSNPKDGSTLPNELLSYLQIDRRSLLRADALRSLAFICLTAVLLWASLSNKIKSKRVILLMGVLVVLDMWPIGKRYLNSSFFVPKKSVYQVFAKRPADGVILEDKDPYYRVLDLSVNTFNDSHISYLHKTIGGYNAAKLQRYQDVIDNCIMPEIQDLASKLSSCGSFEEAYSVVGGEKSLSMLNTKYIVLDGKSAPLMNPNAFGNAWFVGRIEWASSAMDEMQKFKAIDDLRSVAVLSLPRQTLTDDVKKAFEDVLTIGEGDGNDENIQLTEYSPNVLKYRSSNANGGVAVFSEVYYPKGWRAFVDGVEVPIVCANYILRAIPIPAGEHNIEMRFAPKSYKKAEKVSLATSALLVLLLLLSIFYSLKHRKE